MFEGFVDILLRTPFLIHAMDLVCDAMQMIECWSITNGNIITGDENLSNEKKR